MSYRELLMVAVSHIPVPEARFEVYEKARTSLVDQLRNVNPPLLAQDITAHRLQLEQDITEVEQLVLLLHSSGTGKKPKKWKPQSFYQMLKSAIERLDRNTEKRRLGIYTKARDALRAQLEAVKLPGETETPGQEEMRRLERAIKRLEQRYAANVPISKETARPGTS
jgi:hypothetical protein